jgi:TRAP-type C4-dicarboxylate transport system permease large subunit
LVHLLPGFPVLLVLLAVILFGSGGKIHSLLLGKGEQHWPGYREYREAPTQPDCDIEGPAPVAAPVDDELDDLFGEAEEGPSDEAIEKARVLCVERFERFERVTAALENPNLRRFIWVETSLASFVDLGLKYGRHVLVLMILFCAATCTMRRSHIALRSQHGRLSGWVSEGAQLAGNLFVAYAFYSRSVSLHEEGSEAMLTELWLYGFATLALINVFNLIRTLPKVESEGIGHSLLSIPLYTGMALLTGSYFTLVEAYPAGVAGYLNQLTEHALLYVNVGLYVWTGMMLKRSRLGELAFDLIRHWRLPPEVLAFVVVVVAALPTAYSGASGIFVIAAGGIIYRELRLAGARKQLAQTATAMSGSLGVVLSPCLLVVIIAALNKQVTTDEIYHRGLWVFLLNIVVLGIGFMLIRKTKFNFPAFSEAALKTARSLLPLLPYGFLAGLVIVGFHWGLDSPFDEHTAPLILPIVLLVLLVYDRLSARFTHKASEEQPEKPEGFVSALFESTSESATHTGALLALMGLSVCLGGIAERAELMQLFPAELGSPALTMLLLVVVLVVVGMTMDPYGAVILISSTVATLAYANGIDPVHFWLVVLSAFELGYLTPPVALNMLLTRQIIGDEEFDSDVPRDASFWARHERVLFAVTSKGVVLLIVAFLPLWL